MLISDYFCKYCVSQILWFRSEFSTHEQLFLKVSCWCILWTLHFVRNNVHRCHGNYLYCLLFIFCHMISIASCQIFHVWKQCKILPHVIVSGRFHPNVLQVKNSQFSEPRWGDEQAGWFNDYCLHTNSCVLWGQFLLCDPNLDFAWTFLEIFDYC